MKMVFNPLKTRSPKTDTLENSEDPDKMQLEPLPCHGQQPKPEGGWGEA